MKKYGDWLVAHLDSGDIGICLIAVGCSLYSLRLALVVVGAIYLLREHPMRSWF